MKIKKNSITALKGESGAGKTLLSLAMAGLLPPNIRIVCGSFYMDGVCLTSEEHRRLRGKGIFYAPQNASASFNPGIKMKRQLLETMGNKKHFLQDIMTRLGFSGIQRILNSYPFELSEGENQRCLLALGLLLAPRLIILDEPAAGLDELARDDFLRMLKVLQKEEILTIFMITHSTVIINRVADYVYSLKAGRLD